MTSHTTTTRYADLHSCNHELYAQKFFPTVLEYIRWDEEHMDTPDSQAIANNVEHGNAFDTESIMIYDADLMSKDKAGGKYVLFQRTSSGGIGRPVWMGGGVNGDPATTQVSSGDVERIGLLYPLGPASSVRARAAPQGPLRVKIRDRLDVVVPAPRRRDEL